MLKIEHHADKIVLKFRYVTPERVGAVQWVIKVCCNTFFLLYLIELCGGRLLLADICMKVYLPRFIPQIIPSCYQFLAQEFTQLQIPTWGVHVVFVTFLFIPLWLEPFKIPYLVARIFRRRVKVTFFPDKMIITRGFIFRRTLPRDGSITFESIRHTSAKEVEDIQKEIQKPPNPITMRIPFMSWPERTQNWLRLPPFIISRLPEWAILRTRSF